MPAKSQRQHGFMGYVLQYKRTGRMPKKIRSKKMREKIRKAAQRMTIRQIKDYLETKTKNLPVKKSKKRKKRKKRK